MSVFDNDDFYTYGAHRRVVEFTGCGGEFCAGPYGPDNLRQANHPPECSACRSRVKSLAEQLVPNGWGTE